MTSQRATDREICRRFLCWRGATDRECAVFLPRRTTERDLAVSSVGRRGVEDSPPREEKGKTEREKERRNETDRSSSQSDCATYPLSNVPSKPDLGDVLCLIVFFPFILIANLAK